MFLYFSFQNSSKCYYFIWQLTNIKFCSRLNQILGEHPFFLVEEWIFRGAPEGLADCRRRAPASTNGPWLNAGMSPGQKQTEVRSGGGRAQLQVSRFCRFSGEFQKCVDEHEPELQIRLVCLVFAIISVHDLNCWEGKIKKCFFFFKDSHANVYFLSFWSIKINV